jgi:hypothetical protein
VDTGEQVKKFFVLLKFWRVKESKKKVKEKREGEYKMARADYCLYQSKNKLLENSKGEPLTDLCIVLDLDSTLICTQDEEDIELFRKYKIMTNPEHIALRTRCYYLTLDDYEEPGIGSVYDFWGTLRPYTKEFLEFCFSYFRVVAVWSAGQAPYVEKLVDFLFADLPQPHVVFTFNHIEKGKKTIKLLDKMYNYNDFTKKYMNETNTLILDDNKQTFSKNKDNAVHIPGYEPKPTLKSLKSTKDRCLIQFMYWLCQEEVRTATDIQVLNKSNIFKTSIETYEEEIQD